MNLKIEEEIQGLNQKNCKHVAWGTDFLQKKKTKNKKKQAGNIYKSKLIIVITVKIID